MNTRSRQPKTEKSAADGAHQIEVRSPVCSTIQFKVKTDRFTAFELNLRGFCTELVGGTLNAEVNNYYLGGTLSCMIPQPQLPYQP
jgi:hypothetical protein